MVALLHLQAKYIYSFNLLWFDIWLISSSLFSMQEMHLNYYYYYYMWKHYIKVALRSIYTKKMSSRDIYHQLTAICSDCMYCEVLEKPLLHCVSASSSLIFLCDIKKKDGRKTSSFPSKLNSFCHKSKCWTALESLWHIDLTSLALSASCSTLLQLLPILQLFISLYFILLCVLLYLTISLLVYLLCLF